MKTKLFVMAGLLLSTQAFALQDMQCSNADGSIKRVEQEIWGANPVFWDIQGKRHNGYTMTADFTEKNVLFIEDNRPVDGNLVEVASYKVKLTNGSAVLGEDYVICIMTQNELQD